MQQQHQAQQVERLPYIWKYGKLHLPHLAIGQQALPSATQPARRQLRTLVLSRLNRLQHSPQLAVRRGAGIGVCIAARQLGCGAVQRHQRRCVPGVLPVLNGCRRLPAQPLLQQSREAMIQGDVLGCVRPLKELRQRCGSAQFSEQEIQLVAMLCLRGNCLHKTSKKRVLTMGWLATDGREVRAGGFSPEAADAGAASAASSFSLGAVYASITSPVPCTDKRQL